MFFMVALAKRAEQQRWGQLQWVEEMLMVSIYNSILLFYFSNNDLTLTLYLKTKNVCALGNSYGSFQAFTLHFRIYFPFI